MVNRYRRPFNQSQTRPIIVNNAHAHMRKLNCHDRLPSNSLACRATYPVRNEELTDAFQINQEYRLIALANEEYERE